MGSIQANPASESFEAQAHLYKHIFSHINGAVLKCAVQLRIPDIIHSHGQPLTIPQLASKLEVHPTKTASIERLVRLLVHNGFLAETKVNEEEQEGRRKHILSLHLLSYLWFKEEEKTIVESAFGLGFWDLLERDHQYMKSFNEGMASDSQMMNMALRDCKSIFDKLETLVDVGGGTGTTCRIISERYPNLKCIVFDLPQVVESSSGSHNLTYVGGSMFESIPFADAVLLKWILHNWDDESSVKILNKCKEAISKKDEGGKVIIIDAVLKEKEDDNDMAQVKLLFDILMMSTLNGKERTEKEWNKLLVSAGFKHHKITPLFGFRSIIEAYP
ncbi:isoflavone-7-O-methyltransferase 9-like [Neltuma alba]|uniref:isoflavone-7-O-methyltransferase 9-like n=1 Tax=Neltuma alba TaxID=207710 RepID=UPI0010A44D17|nr:isoflavone-7-O-methyltransferase 9-like [Prosopis alba]